MKPIWNDIITAAVFIVTGMAVGVIICRDAGKHHCPEPTTEKVIIREPLSGWDILTLAIIKTESEFDSTAVGKDGFDRGILQIRPVYVAEANRILGIERYTHEDAFSVKKSLEMYSIIQEHYNPEHDVQRAIKLHNPNAGLWYSDKVMRNFRELVKQSEIINQL